MPVNPILPLVYVQDLGPTAKLVHDAAVGPEQAQAMARLLAEELLREQAKQVQKTEETAKSSAITDEDGSKGKQQHQEAGKRQPKPDEEEPPPERNDPFVGKLVNRKV